MSMFLMLYTIASAESGQIESSVPGDISPGKSNSGTENHSILPPKNDQPAIDLKTTIKLTPLVTLPVKGTQENSLVQQTAILADTALEKDKAGSDIPFDGKIFGGEQNSFDRVFGPQGGRYHPYISIKSEWTDNVYNINTDEQSSLVTTFSPGMWIGFPRIERIPVSLNPHNAAIGGMRFSSLEKESFDRFLAYILGGIDYKLYSNNTDLNYTSWRLEGMFQYNMPFGLSFRMYDRLVRDRDNFDLGSFVVEDFSVNDERVLINSTPSRIRDYYANQANLAMMFNVSEKYSLLLDYINFYLDYDDVINDWLDRIDHRYSIQLNYKYSPKTSFFLEYDAAGIQYDSATENDSISNFYYAGITWKGTAKTSIEAKGGYQVKEYESPTVENNSTFTMELDMNYLITDKTRISFNLYKALEESDSLVSNGKDTIVAKLLYNQNFMPRIKGNVEFWYETSDYNGFNRSEFNSIFQDRQDKRFLVRPAVQYIVRDWLMTELAYSFENRNSTDNVFDFTAQTLIFSLNAAF